MAYYRFDEDFDGFMEDFGEPFESIPVQQQVIYMYRNKLPKQLFNYWYGVGTGGFGEGLFWMTNPADYQEILEYWLEGTLFENRTDLSVIARTAFGVLYVWAKNRGNIMKIYPMTNAINYFSKVDQNQLTDSEENQKMQYFWGFKKSKNEDYEDINDKPLFERAYKKFGRLHEDEMYGFSHSPTTGREETFDNLDKVKLGVYHDIAKQLGGVQIVTIEI